MPLLRVLMIEDSDADARLVLRALKSGGFTTDHLRVCTPEDLDRALDREWDLVICDYHMPQLDALGALAATRKRRGDVPFIVVTGAADDADAVAVMRAGAQDYVMKDRLARLAPAIHRELAEARDRGESRAAKLDAEHAHDARTKAEAASQAKTRMLAHMSHELRTPLNAIIGFSELLEREIAGPLTTEQREFVETVLMSGRHLLRLIDDLLDLSKIEAGRIRLLLEPTPLASVTASVQPILQPLADKQGVTLEIAIPTELPDIAADPVRLQQILCNLGSNAIKFTGAGGHVTMRATLRDDRVEIAIEDTGSGIRQEDVPRLFREFERLGADIPGAPEGTGLGLALTKQLVELHGGTIGVESRVGEGSTFTVRLAIARES